MESVSYALELLSSAGQGDEANRQMGVHQHLSCQGLCGESPCYPNPNPWEDSHPATQAVVTL